jgi:hypothetical protein
MNLSASGWVPMHKQVSICAGRGLFAALARLAAIQVQAHTFSQKVSRSFYG